MTANFNEDTFGSKHQSSSMIQGTSRRIKGRRSETSESRRSKRMGGGKNFK